MKQSLTCATPHGSLQPPREASFVRTTLHKCVCARARACTHTRTMVKMTLALGIVHLSMTGAHTALKLGSLRQRTLTFQEKVPTTRCLAHAPFPVDSPNPNPPLRDSHALIICCQHAKFPLRGSEELSSFLLWKELRVSLSSFLLCLLRPSPPPLSHATCFRGLEVVMVVEVEVWSHRSRREMEQKRKVRGKRLWRGAGACLQGCVIQCHV